MGKAYSRIYGEFWSQLPGVLAECFPHPTPFLGGYVKVSFRVFGGIAGKHIGIGIAIGELRVVRRVEVQGAIGGTTIRLPVLNPLSIKKPALMVCVPHTFVTVSLALGMYLSA